MSVKITNDHTKRIRDRPKTDVRRPFVNMITTEEIISTIVSKHKRFTSMSLKEILRSMWFTT